MQSFNNHHNEDHSLLAQNTADTLAILHTLLDKKEPGVIDTAQNGAPLTHIILSRPIVPVK